MKSLRLIFISYAPIFLLFPFSSAVGLYVLREAEILLRPENKPFFYFYVFFAAMPLYFLFFRTRQTFGQQILDVLVKLYERFSLHEWIYLFWGVAFSAFYLYIASIRISTFYERDVWILDNVLPILPIDVVIPQRLALVASWFTSIDIAVAVPNLFFILGWLAFLIYVCEGHGYRWYVSILGFSATFFTTLLYHTLYASFEFPSAVLGFIGLYGIWKRKFDIGFLFLVLSVSFKNTGAFQMVAGAALFLYICWEEKSIRRILSSLDLSLIVFLGLYLIANYWGHLYYNFVLIDPSVLVKPVSDKVFWFSSFWAFIQALWNNHTVIFFLGILGAITSRQFRFFSLITLGVLLFSRSLSVRADAVYADIFLPTFSFLTIFGLGYMLEKLNAPWKTNVFFVLFLVVNGYILSGVLDRFPGGMYHLNSNFDGFITKLALRFPEDGFIYQRDISLRPYLYNQRDGDLDAIRFRIYPEERNEFISELSQTGCKLIIAERMHLETVVITEGDLISMGYSETPYQLVDQSGIWVAYSKECNAWEHK